MGLVIIIGPQAVGKMTVGQELVKLTGYQLLFNHMTIDLLSPFLGYTSAMWDLSTKIRLELFNSFVRNHDNPVPGIIFTVMINFDSIEDRDFLNQVSEIFEEAGQEVYIVELSADLGTRLSRNVTENRLREKPSKRDIVFSTAELKASVTNNRLTSKFGEIRQPNYLAIDNSHLTAVETAEQIFEAFFSTQ